MTTTHEGSGNSVGTLKLTDFLLARIAEDESVAQRARPDEYLTTRDVSELTIGDAGGYAIVAATTGRVLAECAAKRVAVDWYVNDDDTVISATVKAMAAIYADHPDYQQEWT